MNSVLLTAFTLSIFGPLLGCIVALLGGQKKSVNTLTQIIFSISAAAGLAASLSVLTNFITRGSAALALFDINIFGSRFMLDGWSSLFLSLITLGSLLASLFAIGYLPKYQDKYSFRGLNTATGIFIVGMQLVILSTSVFSFLLFWEVMSIVAYFLVIADREEASIKAGLLYFIMTHLGVASLLAGFLLLSNGNAFASFTTIVQQLPTLSASTISLAFFFLLIGFGSKAGLVPVHQWLPYAHPQAPSHSSALMSGVMLKVAFYGFLRVLFLFFPALPIQWAFVVLALGLISALFGVLHASVETDLKKMLAWSSIENIGLLFAMVGGGLVARSAGLSATPFFVAAGLHAINHMVFKTGLFLSSGAIISETHTRDMDEMGGLAQRWPTFSKLFLGLVFAAAALPPFGTFYGEWIFMQQLAGTLLQGTVVTRILFITTLSLTALVGGLAIFTFGKAFATIFLAKARSAQAAHAKPLSRVFSAIIGVSAALSLVLGFFAGPVSRGLAALITASQTTSFPAVIVSGGGRVQPLFILGAMILVGCIVILVRQLFTTKTQRNTDTWDCGQPITARMEYTATGFAAPIRFFFRSLLLTKKELIRKPVVASNPWVVAKELQWSTHSLWEHYVYMPIGRCIVAVSTKTKRLQSGVIQLYILMMFLTLVAVLLIAL